ncbi:MAG: hypothetical protein M1308_16185 [Actinobacteria bacterium]|nr:hypothetical protein [Actinomycetota bacterium]
MKRPKGIIIFGTIFIIIAISYIVGIINAVNNLIHLNILIDRITVVGFIYSFIGIIGFLYVGIKILNLNYFGVYIAYVMCLFRLLDGIQYGILYTLKEINGPRITVFIFILTFDLFLFIVTFQYFNNPKIKEYLKNK